MTDLPKEIDRLHALGFAIHWLRPNSKVPVESGWTSGERKTIAQLKRTFKADYNFGVRLGSASRLGASYLAVIDVDIKSNDPKHRKEAIHKLLTIYPQLEKAPCLISGRGNGSCHYYVRLKKPVSGSELKARSTDVVKVLMPSVKPSRKEQESLSLKEINDGLRLRPAWEISLLSEGRQSVLVGSVHPDTKKQYLWKTPVDDFGANMPLLMENGNPDALKFPQEQYTIKNDPTAEKRVYPDVSAHELGLRPDQVLAITEGVGVTDRSAEIYALCMALVQRGVSDDKIISIFTRRDYYLGNASFDHALTPFRDRAARWVERYCLAKAKQKVNEIDFDLEVTENPVIEKSAEAPKPKGVKTAEGWEAELETKPGAKGKPASVKATYINLRLILGNNCKIAGFLKHDAFRLTDTYTCNTPWGCKKDDQRSSGQEDALKVKNWLSKKYGMEPALYLIDEVLNTVAIENSYHPLRDYLNNLRWDGVERVATAFKKYLGATMPDPYLADVTRKFFLACVKRAFEPGCKFDHVIVLEGFQGLGKSTFADILAGKQWFLDGLPNFNDKDAALYLQGTWICELSELAVLFKSNNETAKSFITRKIDRFRPPYGQRRIDFPRTTIFMGTTNSREYLSDPSGNRRYWPVLVKKCDFKGIEKERDQLWAEAMFLYTYCDEPLYLTDKAKKQAERIQEMRRVEDEGDAMAERLKPWAKNSDNYKDGVTISELFNGPFLMIPQTSGNMRRAAEVLRKAGFRKVHTEHGNRWKCN